MYICRHVKYPLLLSDFNESLILDRFSKNNQHQISWKSVQWEPRFCVRTGGQTDRYHEADIRLSQCYEPVYKQQWTQ